MRHQNYEINSRQLFLTYPQCTLTKDQALEELYKLFDIEEYVVAHEFHKNGDSHIHAYIKLSDSADKRFRTPTFADIGGFHGNYQGCRSVKNVLKYCTKAEDYLSNIDLDLVLGKKSSRTMIAKKIINEKRSLPDLISEEHPELIFGYTKLKLDIDNFLQDKGTEKEPLPPYLPNPWGKILCTRIHSKQRHYWVYSDKPNLGKTYSFAKPLASVYRAVISTNFTYWNVPHDTELLLLDEYNTAQLKWNELNQLADGTFSFRIFQGGIRQLKSYMVVILSNQSIKTLYPFMYEFIEARFKQIKLD